jgi:hypothetical protein
MVGWAWSPLLAQAELGVAPRGPAQVRELAAAIDRQIDQRLVQEKLTPSPVAEDTEFLRRAFLDITGRLPTAQQAAAFLDDPSSDKRARLIDELLASPAYGQHFSQVWVNLFIRRDANMLTPPDPEPLAHWLADRFNNNHGWDRTVAELLTAEGATREKPQVLFFNLNGDSRAVPQPNVIAGSLGQLFLGVQLQCAECHNHPLDKWKQDDIWGVAAFFAFSPGSGRTTRSRSPAVSWKLRTRRNRGKTPRRRPRARPLSSRRIRSRTSARWSRPGIRKGPRQCWIRAAPSARRWRPG